MNNYKITEKMIDEWVELYKTNETCASIARKYNVGRASVSKYLKARGVKILQRKKGIVGKKITMSMVKEWIEFAQKGELNAPDVAKEYGVSDQIVKYYVRMYGYRFSRNTHHRPKYDHIICLYDKNEQLAYCFDSAYEMSKKTGKSYNGILSTLSRYRKGQLSGRMLINGNKYQIRLIDKENEDETRK